MTPRARRIVIPLVVLAAVGGLMLLVLTSSPRPRPTPEDETPPDQAAEIEAEPGPDAPVQTPDQPPPSPGAEDGDALPPPVDDADQPPAPVEEPTDAAADQADTASAENLEPAGPSLPLKGLRAVAPDTGVTGHETPPAPLGSLDPRIAQLQLEFSRAGAGIARIPLANVWETSDATHQAERHWKAVEAGKTPEVQLPPDELRYVVKRTQRLTNPLRGDGYDVPVFATHQIIIEGQPVNLLDFNRNEAGEKVFIWAEVAPGVFETVVRNGEDEPVLRIRRAYELGAPFDILVKQRLFNLTNQPLEIEWSQFGPGTLDLDRSRYMDRRRFRFANVPDAAEQPARDIVLVEKDQLVERSSLLKRWERAEEARLEALALRQAGLVDEAAAQSARQLDLLTIWPNETAANRNYELSWFASTNRYFGLAVHPGLQGDPPTPIAGGIGKSLAHNVSRILLEVSQPVSAEHDQSKLIFTYLRSPVRTIEPNGEIALDMGLFAGPLDRHLLENEQPFVALNMDSLILYQMSAFCAICTFQWLAHGLIAFLSILHDYIVFDWAIAIIILVVIVRALLHPLTKKSQVSMQRFGRVMTKLKPEIDKLQKKYKDEPKRLQAEQMKLMREHNVNPLQMLGCLPMLLQTPIWIALYAMLYFAFDLRHEPAFFGVFQLFGNWSFLADLSAADHFFWEFDEPYQLFFLNITGLNLLPILMGVIFFIHQKYMTPPPSPTMTDEQIMQQRIMKVMMVVLFPIFLYSAPSGLTLYILTSSTIGIFESRYIRQHVKEMDLDEPPKPKRKKAPAKKPRGAEGRAHARAMQRMEQRRKSKKQPPPPRYKKRK